MNLTRDFSTDFDAITAGLNPRYSGPAYAFSRFADGEADILAGRHHFARSDGWQWYGGSIGTGQPDHPQNSTLPAGLLAALQCDLPGWHVGITAESHHLFCHRELLPRVRVPESQITFAEILIFDNYRRWVELELSHCWFVSSLAPKPGAASGWTEVPRHAVNINWDHRPIVDFLVHKVHCPILVAAGPYAKLIVHDYWRETQSLHEFSSRRKEVILDVGSALDQFLPRGRARRAYQLRKNKQSTWVPKWKV